MKTLRAATTLAVCFWMMLPSTDVLALCIDADGSLALEVAIDGTCTGSTPSDRRGATARELGFEADIVDRCGDCTDVVLGGSGAAVPAHGVSSKHRLERQANQAPEPVATRDCSPPTAFHAVGLGSLATVPERSPTRDSVVLRL